MLTGRIVLLTGRMTPRTSPVPEVAVSEELFAPVEPGTSSCATRPSATPTDDPLLLVMGLGGPMTWWDADFCELLAARGFYVIRYDNRDTGRSSRVTGPGDPPVAGPGVRRAPGPAAVHARATWPATPSACWTTSAWTSAHVVGVSMGGMIAQTMAIEHPRRVRSLTSIMSTTGKRTVGWQHPALLPDAAAPRAAPAARRTSTERGLVWRRDRLPGYPRTARRRAAKAGGDLRPRRQPPAACCGR